jgi:hypothetical protein
VSACALCADCLYTEFGLDPKFLLSKAVKSGPPAVRAGASKFLLKFEIAV